ncbi:hypothetical protein PFICI_00404 [Pestalotiopsis fici W106-1]|uniref:Uncharacterized protein n=1 Tax=Pestalotiopsis fici (strain W106-1 / CGMCC3.15140) TaxID=1229662 RepID=W3XMQ0_PESFW|nr:uncharacterized protein PFICI_00404 [Pestalotiopsis fici W106-1]ETS86576.1 hypothetical protein PFICI_00404 [Pestalotiopsis fici W106-1]
MSAGTLDPDDYTVAWIAPLEIEARAALHLLDKRHHGRFPVSRGDNYVFHGGSICGHNVIIATLPAGQEYGTGSAAALASQMKKFFPNLWFGLLVGVAAGLPALKHSPPRDIRLGDVLIALPEDGRPGIIAYDLGKETEGGIRLLRDGHVLAMTEPIVRSAIGSIKLHAPNDAAIFLPYYETIRDKQHANGTFIDPGQDYDTLYLARDDGTEEVVERTRRLDAQRTRVWYGPIGSGEKLSKNARWRDELRDRYGIIGLEMEAAGTMNQIPVGVIRGVCDYGDMHKNKEWQPYAAAMAAAYAKTVLCQIPPKTPDRLTRSVPHDKMNQTRVTARSIVLGDSAGTYIPRHSPNVTFHEPSHPQQHKEPFSTVTDADAIERAGIATWPRDPVMPLGMPADLVASLEKWVITRGAQYLPDIHDSLSPLMPVLRHILHDLAVGNEMDLCGEHSHWLWNEFRCILMKAVLSKPDKAQEILRPQEEQRPRREEAQGRPKRKHSDVQTDNEVSIVTKRRRAYTGQNIRRTPDLRDQYKSRRYKTSEGNLLVQTRYGKRDLSLLVHFTLIPTTSSDQRDRTGFTMIFQRAMCGQNIERCLRTFRTVEWEDSAFEMIENGDLDSLKAALSDRIISPFDRLADDESTLISFASRQMQLGVCEFLLDFVEGTDPCEVDRIGTVAKLLQRGCLEDESWQNREADDGCLHLSGLGYHVALPAWEISEMISLFIKHGAGLEIKDQYGKTPLLDNINITGELGHIVIRRLLDSKANVAAVDDNGNGVFHLVLEGHHDKPKYLQERLKLLLQYTTISELCRPNEQGYTPSDFALTSSVWRIWCETVAARIPLQELLQRDSFLKKDHQENEARDTTPHPRPIRPRQRATRTVTRGGEIIAKKPLAGPTHVGVADHRSRLYIGN